MQNIIYSTRTDNSFPGYLKSNGWAGFSFSNGLGVGGYDPGTTSNLVVNGNVGIGTTLPLAKLDISGSASVSANMNLAGAGTAHTFNILDNGTLNFVRSPGGDVGATMANSMLFLNNNGNIGIGTTGPSQALDVGSGYIVTMGRVGIGTTSPLVPLQIAGTAEFITGNGTLSKLRLTQTGQNNWDLAIPASTSRFDIQEAGTPRLTILSQGNVGIGTTLPRQLLDVLGKGGTTQLRLSSTDNSVYSDIKTDQMGYLSFAPSGLIATFSATINPNATSTYDLGSTTRYWNNVYANNIISPSSGTSGYWQRNLGAVFPTNITDDLLIGGISTAAAKFSIVSSTGTASSSGSFVASTFKAPTGALNLQYKSGANAWTNALTVLDNSGNIGIGTTAPTGQLHIETAGILTQKYVAGASSAINLQFGDTADDNIGIISYNNNGDYMYFRTNNSEQVRINSSGNVGIGITSPSTKLAVNGNALIGYAEGTAGGPASGLAVSGSVGIGTTSPSQALDVGSGYIVTLGRIGVGTTSPSYPLDIQSSGGVTEQLKATTSTNSISSVWDNTNGTLRIGVESSTGGTIIAGSSLYSGVISMASTRSLHFGTTSVVRMTIDSSGNVGIGTTAPLSPLHISGGNTGGRAVLIVDQIGSSNNDILTASASGVTKFYVTNAGNVVASQFIDLDNTIYYLDPASTGTSLATRGNIGIGTTNPLSALDVTGTASISANLSLDGAATAHTFNILDNGTLDFRRSPSGDVGATAANSVLFLNNNGNIGIGTTGPGAKLDLYSTTTSGTDFRIANNGITTGTVASISADLMNSGTLLNLRANSLNTGTMLSLNSTSTGLTTGGLASLDWSPTGTTTIYATGDLLSINAGQYASVGNLLNLKDNGSSVFSVSQTAITANLPASFTSAGDVSMAYDLLFTNPTASYIKSAAPLYLEAGESFGSSDLSLRTFGKGNVIIDSEAFVTNYAATVSGQLVVGTATPTSAGIGGMYLTNSATYGKALAIFNQTESQDIFTASSSGTPRFVIQNGGNVGIGTSAPSSLLSVGGTSQFQVNSTGAIAAATGITSSGTITFSNFNANNKVLYATVSTGVLNGPSTDTQNLCLVSGASAPTWGPCNTGVTTDLYWNQSSGVLFPNNSTVDFAIGGQSTSAAKFAFINMNSGTPTASISGNLALAVPSGNAPASTISLLNNGTLNFLRSPGGDVGATMANSILFLNNNGNVGIGITAPNNRLEVLSTTEPQVRFSYDASNYTTFDVNNVGAMTMIAYGSGATPINIQANGTTGGSDISLNTDYAWYYKNRNGTLDSTLFTQGELSVGLAGAASFSQVANIPFTVYDMSAGYATTNRAAFIEKTGNMYLKGNLGIGTSSPLAGLDITGSASLSANFNLRGAATAHTFNILDNGTLNFVRSPGGDAGATMANSIMFLNNNGKIGIGTTNPSDVLDINGNMRLRALANSQDIFVIKPFTDTGTSGFFQRMQTVAGADVFAFDTNGTFTMGGTLTTTQTTFNLANATATTINFGGAAATLNMGAGTGTATINNAISYIVGNLGVKNSNPLTALDVTGSASLSANLSLRGAATAHTFNILDNGTLNFVRSPGGDAGLATALFIQNNGNIGIGTTGPASLLTVGSSSLDSSTVTDANLYALLRSTSDTNGQGVGLGFQNSSGATVPGAAIVFLRTGSNGIGDLAFYTKSVTDNTTAPSERLRILSGGNVGIGTTAPIGKLHVDGTNIGKALAIFNETGTNDILTASASGVTKFYLTNSGNVVASQFVDLDNTIYYLDPASAGISLATKGNIGIGTTTPRANLDIVGSASVSANMNLAGATTAHTFNILDNGTLNFVRSPGGDAGATMANSMLFLNNNGNVGIGTTAPGGNLEVSGAGFDNNGTIYTKQGNLIISGTGNRTAGLGGQLSFVASDKTGSSTTTTLAASINGFAENSTDSNAAGALAFHTTYWNGSAWVNTEKMRITSGGNVGIGTTAPGTYKLNVAGTGYFMSSLDVGDRIRITGGSGGYFYNADSTNITKAMFNSAGDWLGLQTDASNVFSFADKAAEDNSLATPVLSFKLAGGGTGGNVGIGTTNPDYALDVNGQIGAQNQLTIAGSWAQVQAGTANIDLNLKTIAGTGGIMFITNNTNQGYLDSTGRLGIGTTNPGYKLTVNDNSTTYATVFLQNNADGWGSYIWVNNADTDKDAFHIDNSSGGIFVVRNGGNVGIGTTAPSEVLSVSGNATISGTLAVNTIKPPTGALNLQYKSGANAWTNGITLLDNSGNVGIGTTGPSAKLEVAGEILGQFATGTNLIAYDNAGRTTTATTYTKVEEMQLGWGGSLTVKFNLDGSCSGFNCAGTAYGRLYKNGSAVGTERTATIATNDGTCNYTTYSENLTGLVSGDLIQVYGKVVNTSGTNTSCVDDFQLYANYAPTAKVTSTNTDTGDIAENYITPQEELIGSGDIVSIDKSSTGETPILSKSKTAYDTKMAGIVSTNPAITLDEKTGENGGLPIALVGRIPVKVVLEGGKIKAGDPITSSSIPGVGMKAEQAGSIIGKALEGWDNSDENKIVGYFNKDSNKFIYEQGDLPADYSPLTYPNILPIAKIMVFADLGWYDPGPVIADTGELKIVSSMENEAKSSSSGILNTKYLIQNTAGQIVQRVGAFAEIAVANVRAGLIQAQEISTDSLKIATDNVSIGGVTLKDYITQTVSTLLASKGQAFQGYDGKIISPIAEVDQIHAGVISPLAQNPDLIIRLAADTATHSSQLVIQNASGSAVATIDSSGNASFAGQLSSNSLTSNDATISGTLRAKNIIADSIEGLNARIATIAAGYIKPLAQSNNSTIEQSASSSSTLNSSFIIPNSGQINIASFSSQLAYVQNLTSDNAVFNQGLMVFGPTSLSDISVTGQLSVGGNMILSDGAINVLGSSLELQPLKQGALSIMGGLVYIDTDGNMRVGGNAEFAKDVTVRGRLMANIISPIPDSDLVIKLGNQEQNHNSSFVIHNSSDSAVLSINQLGDVIASGAGSFAKLNLNPISQAIALSDHEVIATGSAGVATISAHLTELTIRNNLVTEKSLIYITPVGNTNNQVLYLLRQIPDVSFTVGISQPVLKEIPFNWMLVN
ncbi:MAG: hypothetical protein Q8P80_03070 [Candidatus Levybacteria bacterium]|nr:hypothetical protein [Candidatus Levybacteria bacterium]